MKGFANSNNPYMSGLRPRTFFAARVAMLKRDQMRKKVDKDAYPKYDLNQSNVKKNAA